MTVRVHPTLNTEWAESDRYNPATDTSKPSLAYCIALVLNAREEDDLTLHRRVVRALMSAELQVAIMEAVPGAEDKIVILIEPFEEHFGFEEDDKNSSEFSTLRQIARKAGQSMRKSSYFSGFSALPSEPARARKLTEAERISNTYHMVQQALDFVNVGADGQLEPFDVLYGGEKNTPFEKIVHELLPINDNVWNKKFLESMRFKPQGGKLDLMRRMQHFYRKWIRQDPQFLRIEDIKAQFGDQISTSLYSLLWYRKWLGAIAIFCTIHYMIARFVSWPVYVVDLTFIGIGITCFCGTHFIHKWEEISRRNSNISTNSRDSKIPNPYCTKDLMAMTERQRRMNRRKVNYLTIAVVIINILILVPVSLAFTQWYVYAKMAPTCECCDFFVSTGIGNGTLSPYDVPQSQWPEDCYEEYMPLMGLYPLQINLGVDECNPFVQCFHSMASTVGTDRWVYIFTLDDVVQGIFMGLILDVLQTNVFSGLTKWIASREGHVYLSAFNTSVIRKQFLFIWINMFFWYLSITLAYAPYGEIIQGWIVAMGYANTVPPWGWRPTKLLLDEAFVTPVIVTAFVNAVVETVLPIIFGKLKMEANEKRERLHRSEFRKISSKLVRKHLRSKKQQKAAAKKDKDTSEPQKIPPIPEARSFNLGTTGVEETQADISDEKLENVENGSAEEPKLAAIHSIPSRDRLSTPTILERSASQRNASIPYIYFESLLETLPEETMEKISFIQETPDRNAYDATDILSQTFLTRYDENADYLFMVMQLGYVSMFSSIWGLLPLAASIRLMFSYRASMFKLFYSSQRYMPYGVSTVNEWIQSAYLTFLFAIPVVIAEFALSSGGLDYMAEAMNFVPSNCTWLQTNWELMMPSCTFISTLQRIVVTFTGEHVLLLLFAIAYVEQAIHYTKRHMSLHQIYLGTAQLAPMASMSNLHEEHSREIKPLSPKNSGWLFESQTSRLSELTPKNPQCISLAEVEKLVSDNIVDDLPPNARADVTFSILRILQNADDKFGTDEYTENEFHSGLDLAADDPIVAPYLKPQLFCFHETPSILEDTEDPPAN